MTSLDILYIVLAFCALWITIALFWVIWQIATVVRKVNDTLELAREKITQIEGAMTAIRGRIEHATSSGGVVVDAVKKLIEYALEKKRERALKNQEDVYDEK